MSKSEPWAKTEKSGETRSIIEHCSDVAAMFRALLSGSVMRARFETAFREPLGETHLDRLAILAGLHDFGKASKGFQDKLLGPSITGHTGHVAEALAVLLGSPSDVREALRVDLLGKWFKTVTDAVFTAVCHHGEPVDDPAIQRHLAVVSLLLQETMLGHKPTEQITRLGEALLASYPAACADPEAQLLTFTPQAQHLFAGLLMAADWMASGFAFDPGTSEDRAQTLIEATAWRSWWNCEASPLDLLGNRTPRAAQAALMDELTLEEHLVVLEAPTGTGKTEAALVWGSRLVEAGLVDGLYFAVPTRSAATELHERIGRLMSSSHEKLRGKVVRAVPGMLDVDSRPDYPAETWAVAAPKRVFAAPVAVGTIDQALLSAVRTRHAWMRAAMLSRHLIVVDEVHASDPYMASLTKALITRHLRLGGYALAMSATLGETALAELQEDRPRLSFETAVKQPYPAIRTMAGSIHLGGALEKTTRIDFRGLTDATSWSVKPFSMTAKVSSG